MVKWRHGSTTEGRLARGAAGGIEGLKRRPVPGKTPRLSGTQRAQLPALLARGAEAYGFRGDVWTARRVAQLIADCAGYFPDPEAKE